MPLVTFTANSASVTLGVSQVDGMLDDGTYRFVHRFTRPPPDDVEWSIKQVYVNAGGRTSATRCRDKEPTLWTSVEFPQLKDEIISTDDGSFTAVYKERVHSVNKGVLRFPTTLYPVSGREPGLRDSNAPGRSSTDADSSFLSHRGFHSCHIPLGRIKLEENFLECIVRPYARMDRQLVTSNDAGGDLWPRIRHIQVVLEYK